ncbi:CAP domain-containing protein [Pseudoduganella violaceinigra]|uniref:CAP domain-containing protein n=1 Tax=Pseudoduganella violaceinigra TaxID=246602 RepID=UPI0012B58B2A|nr:CAP domain-containing protein [Pseudoduganella violaceinigra]
MKMTMALPAARILVAALAAVLAGCGGSSSDSSKPSGQAQATQGTTPTTPTTPGTPTTPSTGGAAAINTSNKAEVLAFYKTTMLPAFSVPMQWSGSTQGCVAGTTSAEYKAAVVNTVNSFRVLAGLPGNVTLNLTHSAMAQQAALMMEANSQLSHSPPSSWNCYTADGATAAGSSNLALGNAGPNAVHAYIADSGTASLGHRRWVLYSRLGEVGTGDTTRANTLWVFGGTVAAPAAVADTGVAWPARGYVPWTPNVADPNHPWSFSLPGADFSGASVAMSNDQGQVLSVSNVGPLPDGYGDNTMSWKLSAAESEWKRSPADTKFNVQIRNVKVGGQVKSFDYSVTFFVP